MTFTPHLTRVCGSRIPVCPGAVAQAARGHSLTDSAHFPKTFKAMFALSPAALANGDRVEIRDK
jgi:hypothetical protein